jgi:hypothetical protein
VSHFDPRERILESLPDDCEVEACIMSDEVGLRVKIDKGLEILGTD